MRDSDTLKTALQNALRVMNEQYLAIVNTLRKEGITLSVDGVWQSGAYDAFEKGHPINPGSDKRVSMAEELRQVRAEARRALGIIGADGSGPNVAPDAPAD